MLFFSLFSAELDTSCLLEKDLVREVVIFLSGMSHNVNPCFIFHQVTDPEHVVKYIYKCSELLLRHGADPSYVGHYIDAHVDGKVRHGNVLHTLCESAPCLGRVDSSLLLLLLRHGANPDASVDGQYPLISYIDAISPQLKENPSITGSQASPQQQTTTQAASSTAREVSHTVDSSTDSDLFIDVRRMCRMVGFMSLSAQQDCLEILKTRLLSHSSAASSAAIALRMAVRELESYTQQVSSLRRCCAGVVWRCCRRHVGNVYKLPVPMPLINVVMDHLWFYTGACIHSRTGWVSNNITHQWVLYRGNLSK